MSDSASGSSSSRCWPGWFVRESPSPNVRVVNPKILPDVIRGRGERLLDDQQIDLITRLLDERYRDVAD